jgi:DNA replication protein DnaC
MFPTHATVFHSADIEAIHDLGAWCWTEKRATHAASSAGTLPFDCPTCGEVIAVDLRKDPRCDCEMHKLEEIRTRRIQAAWPTHVEHLWSGANIPARFREHSFENFQGRKGLAGAAKAAREYADNLTRQTTEGLWLIGSFGVGKTHLAIATARAAVELHLARPLFTTASALISGVMPDGDRRGFDWSPLERALNADLLILDDLGQEQVTKFARDIVYRVINGRYEAARPLIITTNAGDSQLRERLGGAAVSRLYEMTRPVLIEADDYRKQKRGAA